MLLVIGVAVASCGFSVLSTQSETSTLETIEQVEANSRGAYDILVRPAGSPTEREHATGAVQSGFQSNQTGGISEDQLDQIRAIGGVEVAAPLAIVGFLEYQYEAELDAEATDPTPPTAAQRMSVSYSYDNGASTVERDPLVWVRSEPEQHPEGCIWPWQRRAVNLGTPIVTCGYLDPNIPLSTPKSGGLRLPVPMAIAAVDPDAERQLTGLADAVVSGEYLPSQQPDPQVVARDIPKEPVPVLPVLAATEIDSGMIATYRVDRLTQEATRQYFADRDMDALLASPGQQIGQGSITQQQAYRGLVDELGTPENPIPNEAVRFFFEYNRRAVSPLFRVSAPQYDVVDEDGTIEPRSTPGNHRVYTGPYEKALHMTNPVPGSDDTAYREVQGGVRTYTGGTGEDHAPIIVKVGEFDRTALDAAAIGLAGVPLGFETLPVTGRDAASKDVLGDKPWQATPHLGGYVQPAPAFITTLDAISPLKSNIWQSIPQEEDVSPTEKPLLDAAAPLSSIRVKVAGVTGVDEVSRERVRVVAEQITANTGLQVDIVTGSSPTTQAVNVAAGVHGRPALALTELWTKKGVALAVLRAVDTKSVVLFTLIVAVAAMFVLNLVIASVRARRSELAVRACVGWSSGHIARTVTADVLKLSLAGGVLAAAVAFLIGVSGVVPVTWDRALWGIPAAVAIALPAALAAAWLVRRVSPLVGLQPAVAGKAAARSPRTVAGLAWINTRRDSGRSALAVIGLVVAVAAACVVAGVVVLFRGAIVGSFLGDAIAVSVRGADIAAVVGIIVLAGFGVGNVVFLNVRERGNELAILHATGWTTASLVRLVLWEGAFLGLAGGVIGALVGVAALALLAGGLTWPLVAIAGASVAAGVLIALLATIPPVIAVTKLPTAQLLTEESV